MYHVIAAFHGEHAAQHIAQRMNWDTEEEKKLADAPSADAGFSQSDFESALRRVSRKI